MLKSMILLIFLIVAVIKDRQKFSIPNELIVVGAITGLFLRFYIGGWQGMADAVLGGLLPLVLCGWLFVFSMLGAGDIKLLMMVGVYFTPIEIVKIIMLSFVIGAVICLPRIINLVFIRERELYFSDYIVSAMNGEIQPYIDMEHPERVGEKSLIHFSVPILLAVIFELLVKKMGW